MAPPWHPPNTNNRKMGVRGRKPHWAATGRFCFEPQVPICSRRTIRARHPERFNDEGLNLLFRHDPFVPACLWVTIKPKYVNMADINISGLSGRSAPAQ